MVTPARCTTRPSPSRASRTSTRFTAVHVTDHLNTGLPEPDSTAPREPTVTGVGMRIFMTAEDPKKKKGLPKKDEPRLPIPHKDPKPGINGVDLVELDHAVEFNLWTDADASFVAPGGAPKDPKKDTKKADPEEGPEGGREAPPPGQDERPVPVRPDPGAGPLREAGHVPGRVDRARGRHPRRADGRAGRARLRDARRPVPAEEAAGSAQGRPAAVAGADRARRMPAGDGDLEIKSIKATGETVVMTSDSEKLHATCTELTHDAEAHVTVLKGSPAQPVQAVKDGNLIRGSEMHLFGDGKEITQGHVLGAGSVGLGDLDPKTGEYHKAGHLVRPPGVRPGAGRRRTSRLIDVLTFLGKDGTRSVFRDTSGGQLQQIEAMTLKVCAQAGRPGRPEEGPEGPGQEAGRQEGRGEEGAGQGGRDRGRPADPAGGDRGRPVRVPRLGHQARRLLGRAVPGRGRVHQAAGRADPNAKDPKAPAKGPAAAKADLPAPRVVDPKAEPAPKTKDDATAKEESKKDAPPEKKPIVVSAKTIRAWVNRDPKNRNELDRVIAKGEVQAHQDPATKDELGTDIAGTEVDMKAYKEGNVLKVVGVEGANEQGDQWGVVRFDKLTMFGFDIVVSQRDNTSNVTGRGSMEIISGTDMEGKKLEKPSTMTIYWKHKMDFLGTDKLIYYHGAVQGYQEDSRLKCEWMQVLLDRPVYLNQDLKPKTPAKKPKPGEKKEGQSRTSTR